MCFDITAAYFAIKLANLRLAQSIHGIAVLRVEFLLKQLLCFFKGYPVYFTAKAAGIIIHEIEVSYAAVFKYTRHPIVSGTPAADHQSKTDHVTENFLQRQLFEKEENDQHRCYEKVEIDRNWSDPKSKI